MSQFYYEFLYNIDCLEKFNNIKNKQVAYKKEVNGYREENKERKELNDTLTYLL